MVKPKELENKAQQAQTPDKGIAHCRASCEKRREIKMEFNTGS